MEVSAKSNSRSELSYCRVCHNACPVVVDIEDDRVRRVTGDRKNEVYEGYTCLKGRAHPVIMNRADRHTRSLKRLSDGSFVPISSAALLDEVAERLTTLIDRLGPRAIASYCGTFG
jgi:anaerobic selenocysteine-containing dehydrogenase